MKSKKLLSGMLTLGMLSLSTVGAFAVDSEEVRLISAPADVIPISAEIIPIKAPINELEQTRFYSFRGTVKEINDHWSIEGAKFISLENEDGEPANVIISDSTYVEGEKEFTVGMELTIFYDGTKPMIMIYPPQYSAKVVVADQGDKFVKVDYFDENLVSIDNNLKLNISEKTEIINEDGQAYEGELANKYLTVIYDVTTRSIPAQTNPLKVIVLDMEEEAIENPVEEIEIPKSYTNEEGITMVPLRWVAEKQGFTVKWNGEEQSITLNEESILKIGETEYNVSPEEKRKIETAPVLKDGTTFVPLSFFENRLSE